MGRKKVNSRIIKKRVYPTGNLAWVVDCGMVDGKRPQFTYDKKGEAETKAEQLRIEREKDGNAIFTLSAHDQTDAGRALSILAPFNVSLCRRRILQGTRGPYPNEKDGEPSRRRAPRGQSPRRPLRPTPQKSSFATQRGVRR